METRQHSPARDERPRDASRRAADRWCMRRVLVGFCLALSFSRFDGETQYRTASSSVNPPDENGVFRNLFWQSLMGIRHIAFVVERY